MAASCWFLLLGGLAVARASIEDFEMTSEDDDPYALTDGYSELSGRALYLNTTAAFLALLGTAALLSSLGYLIYHVVDSKMNSMSYSSSYGGGYGSSSSSSYGGGSGYGGAGGGSYYTGGGSSGYGGGGAYSGGGGGYARYAVIILKNEPVIKLKLVIC